MCCSHGYTRCKRRDLIQMCVFTVVCLTGGPGRWQFFFSGSFPCASLPPLPNVKLRATLLLPPHRSLSFPDAGHRTQAQPSALKPACGQPALLGLCEARRGLGGAPGSRGRRCWHSRQPCARSRPRRQPAPGTDQAACERRDSCSCLKYAGYFYLPTSGSEGHPTSGLGGCYTMFPFSREGKWREARLPDHMVLKSMKKKLRGTPPFFFHA